MKKRAIVYARVSTDDQAERGFSLAAQIEAGHKYAEIHGMTVVSELIDDGVSGARAFSDRPAGATAWTTLRQRQADALVVQNVDRLSRDVVDLLVTIRELLRAGVEVHCLDLGRVTSEYDIMLVIRGWQGSDERAKIRERSMRGKQRKATEGLVVAAGEPAYGYEYLRDEKGRAINFVVNEDQAAVVRLIFQWYTQGYEEKSTMSLYAIAKRLSEAGIPAPSNRQRKRAQHIWNTTTISRMLSNPTYKGEWHYKATEEEDFIIQVPSIIDLTTWELAQIQKERNSRKAKRNGKRDYLLTGIVRCGCGRIMSGATLNPKNPHSYYICSVARSYFANLEERTCYEKFADAEKLETAVWEFYLDILRNPETFKAKLQRAQQLELEEQEPKRQELESVNTLILEAEAEATQLAAALTKATGLVEKVIQDKMTALNERYKALETRRDELTAILANRRLTDEAIDATLQFAADVARGIDEPDNAAKRKVIDMFDTRITVQEGRWFIHYSAQTAPIELHKPLCVSGMPAYFTPILDMTGAARLEHTLPRFKPSAIHCFDCQMSLPHFQRFI
ncbi:MAG TPA: recombinase family protein [Anaerolineae bacterium]|nr:recombinase family protein [Anaerolineae bacterium]HQH37475.1 recombinase family protein [Anaerolineae bacterium]